MNSRSYYSPQARPRAIRAARWGVWLASGLALWAAVGPTTARASDAPPWMHALVNAPLPAHDEKTDAVVLYSEDLLNVQANGKIRSIERRAYKILRPGGRDRGIVLA